MDTSSRDATYRSSKCEMTPQNMNRNDDKKLEILKKSSAKKLYDLEEWDNFRKVYASSTASNPTTPMRSTIDFQPETVSLKTPYCNGVKPEVNLKEKILRGIKTLMNF